MGKLSGGFYFEGGIGNGNITLLSASKSFKWDLELSVSVTSQCSFNVTWILMWYTVNTNVMTLHNKPNLSKLKYHLLIRNNLVFYFLVDSIHYHWVTVYVKLIQLDEHNI